MINITPKVLWGQSNRIEMATTTAAGPVTISGIEIRYYNPTIYP
jgi:hypothetical protein